MPYSIQQMDLKIVDISSVTGLIAMAVLTFNLLLGMLLSTSYKTTPLWKKLPKQVKNISLFRLHNYTAYVALLLVLIHPLLLLLDANAKFTFIDIVFPVNAPHESLWVALGTIAMFALIVMIITSQKGVRKKLKFRLWKNIHLISYGTACLFLIHGLKMDPELKDRPTDWLDAEKVFCELCFLVLIIATILRIKYQLKLKKPQKLVSSN
ncbi:MAG: hypothetical protein JWQ06_1562 [Mucilaginibacter sp.]|nr:hypothetical protein [Mucilaginibacter sp.]